MTADELIDRYVADVVALLPRRQRHDVARELRELLTEEVEGRDVETLLADFGHPAEVAARYGQPVTLIDPVDTRNFLSLAIGGVLLIHFGAVLGELIKPVRDFQQASDAAWQVVFAWLGLLFVGFALRAWQRRRRPARWRPRPAPNKHVNRAGRAAALAFYTAGTAVLIDPAAACRMAGLPQPAIDALTYDERFLDVRGPVMFALLLTLLVGEAVAIWKPWPVTQLFHGAVTCAVLTWLIGSGPIFATAAADETFKSITALLILVSLVDLAVRLRRTHAAHALRH
ncbi:hypothetical protein KZZ52_08620 [Dactylosporangium sp. AC04546]|uniref:hypothetical protein n=1 Tax=Dactylosporangium sp. AC04546 TaxID=2862460 RepID=UPI001EDD8C97|nr:hypothetical protein [Dactylosporangium sp. AC04546]WVK85433.1 hypothetical protein KZZ52_08620 [Dactylosporangium sp. AC04546]